MKQVGASVGFTLVLSLAVWVLLYLASSPPAPPGGSETLGLIVIVALLVMAGQWIVNRMRRGKAKG